MTEQEAIAEYSGIVRALSWQYLRTAQWRATGIELDDLVQAGMIGLIKAHRAYDADSGACFKTYAFIRIRGALRDEARTWEYGSRHNPLPPHTSYDPALHDQADSFDLLESIIRERDLETLLARMTNHQQLMIRMRLGGMALDDIGEVFGVSDSSVCATINGAVRRLEPQNQPSPPA